MKEPVVEEQAGPRSTVLTENRPVLNTKNCGPGLPTEF